MIRLKNVSKVYQTGLVKTDALKNIDLKIEEGNFVVILGPSGSGKSTMLNMMGALDFPSEGTVEVFGEKLSDYPEKKLVQFRRSHVGFVFQQYNLLQTLTAAENVEIGAHVSKNPYAVSEALEMVGLEDHADKYPYELSGGEQQRVSIARAVVKRPKALFCDEPTGSLDETVAKKVLSVLKKLNEKMDTTVIVITHNPSIAKIADRVIRLNSGVVAEDKKNARPANPEDISFGP